MKFLFIFFTVALFVASCSAAQRGGILDQRGPCGGDGLEEQCMAHPGCCPNGSHCTASSCETDTPGPRFAQ